MAKTDYSRAMAYYRLSKEDKAKEVSDSIENQRKLIREYVSRQENITLVDEVYDGRWNIHNVPFRSGKNIYITENTVITEAVLVF